MSVFETMITFQSRTSGFYTKHNNGEESLSLERQRKRIRASSISTKFRKVVLENRVGVSQDKMFGVDNTLVDNSSC